ncbi:hypothetical protein FACS1894122_04510 [Alphaproteobacteria bacterium]|nr:hypothetical protein FACS1894122_04510 [Alphaproteobacteria bacterium]
MNEDKTIEWADMTPEEYYLAAFKKLEDSGKNTWNWAAFFGGELWLLYRKMFGICAILLFFEMISIPAFVLIFFLCAFAYFGESIPDGIFYVGIALVFIPFRVFLGICGTANYYDQIKENIMNYSSDHDLNDENIRAELCKTLFYDGDNKND